jgi:hypothetical protein
VVSPWGSYPAAPLREGKVNDVRRTSTAEPIDEPAQLSWVDTVLYDLAFVIPSYLEGTITRTTLAVPELDPEQPVPRRFDPFRARFRRKVG